MKYMRLNNENVVLEVFNTEGDLPITQYFHPDIAAMFVPCDDIVEAGGSIGSDGNYIPIPPLVNGTEPPTESSPQTGG